MDLFNTAASGLGQLANDIWSSRVRCAKSLHLATKGHDMAQPNRDTHESPKTLSIASDMPGCGARGNAQSLIDLPE